MYMAQPDSLEEEEEYDDSDLLNDRPSYLPLHGSRRTSTGKVIKDYVAGAALTALFAGPALPIFEYFNYDRVVMGRNLPDRLKGDAIVSEDGTTFEYNHDIPTGGIKQLNHFLQTELDSLGENPQDYERPLVFLVASGAPHAMIYIISGAKVFSVGFGFHGSPGRGKTPTKLAAAGQHSLAHSIEILNGALYTADYLMPNQNQPAKLAWVGFLTDNIINSIKADLVQVTNIIYTGTIGGGYHVSYNCMLEFGQGYCEAAGFINKDTTTNCIEWAQKKLNIKLDCGWSKNPKNCRPILQEEFDDLINNMNNMNTSNLYRIVTAIQKRLAVGNFCTRIGRTMGLCGGRTSKIRKHIKRKNKNKKTSKKTKKNRRRN